MVHALALIAALPLVASLALASPTPPPPSVAGGAEESEALPILFERDPHDRMTIPVRVGGIEDELRFMVDTGAEQSAISSQLAIRLGLQSQLNRRVISFGGETVVPEVVVGAMNFSDLELREVGTLAFEEGALGSDGLIGIDHLDRQQVRFDFEKGEMTLAPSPHRSGRERRGSIGVDLDEREGRMIISEAYYGRQHIDVILDTGSSITVGNRALLAQLPEGAIDGFLALNMLTVTGDLVPIRYGEMQDVRIGDMRFKTLPVAFASAEPFARLGMAEKPAIILGMDVLRSFGSLTIDFRRREARFTAREGKPLRPRDYWNIGTVKRQGTPRGRIGG